MQYLYDDELYKIVKITGPQHNMLALGFDKNIEDFEIIDLEKSSINSAGKISSIDVKNQVLFGVSEVNNELGTNYKVTKIQFVSSDTSSNSIYIELTKHILKSLESGHREDLLNEKAV